MSEFVHLHVHSQYSLLDGAIRFENLFERMREFGMTSCALTDHGCMFGAAEFYFSAKERGIKPIIGCEAYIAPKSRFEQKKIKGEENAYHLVLLAMDNTGYKNLIKLVTLAQFEGFYYVPRIDKELLVKYNEGLICLTACLKGEIPYLILKEDETALKKAIEDYISIFENRLYFELQYNGLEEQKKVNESLIKLAKYFGIPLVATNDCHYLRREEYKSHEILLSIQTGKKVSDKDRLSFKTDQFYFKSAKEMESIFSDCKEAIKSTLEISEMCNLEIESGTYHFPEFKISENISLEEYFEQVTRRGFEKKIEEIKKNYENFSEEILKKYEGRLNYEIDVIKKTGFVGYFLIVSDFIDFAKKNGIPVGPGRGSAAGSLVAYCLNITDIDPIRYDLLFERFLNPDRVSPPDIDVDFCMEGREKVIEYVMNKYGKENVAQIITFGTMQSRAAIRDVGRALGLSYGEVDRIAKLVPPFAKSIEAALSTEPALKELYERDERVKELLDTAISLEGLARHASTHAAGIVISNKPLTEYLPLYRGTNGETVTQYPMKMIEKIGLVKFDFLGLKTLTIIDTVVKMLKENGIDLDISKIPLDDKKTYELLSSGNTSGVFQLESRGMRELLVRLRPSKFEDIIALIALYRPGPLTSGMIEEFIKRKNNPALITFEVEKLRPILSDTYGVIVYQEQIMRMASELAGFSMKEADALRKAISKKIPEELKNYRESFLEGCLRNGVQKDVAERIYDVILRFGEYGFNKSHSAAYALVAYQTAYLKAHYPTYFMAALLTSEVTNTDNMLRYITECREQGIKVLPPDINESDRSFTVKDGMIRYGLEGIKNVGDAAIENILETRKKVGRFESLMQFLAIVDSRKVNKKVLESLAKAGCFDSFGLRRSQILYILSQRSELSQRESEKQKQPSIFDDMRDMHFMPIPDIEELSREEILFGEKEAFGFYFSEHPLSSYTELIKNITPYDTQKLKEIEELEDHEVKLVGIVNTLREIKTKKGEKMAYITLEDTKGMVEVVVFPDLLQKVSHLLRDDKPIVVLGTVEKGENDVVKLRAKNVSSFELPRNGPTKKVHISIDCNFVKKEDLKRLKDVLFTIRGDSELHIHFLENGEERSIRVENLKINPERLEILKRYFPFGVTYKVSP
ncbi:MAG: DNA polymerase III subunit alpha [Desulfobacterota bacterium]|nr:DNA polymerase III subunit alpha [Thermodesulfobacteriota bacterium]